MAKKAPKVVKAKPPDLSNPAQNPERGQQVQRTKDMIDAANPGQRIAGAGWYRKGAQDAAHLALGISPGKMDGDNSGSNAGITHDIPGTSAAGRGAEFIRNTHADAKADEMTHARSLGQSHAESLASTGMYEGQRVSHATDVGMPFGSFTHTKTGEDNPVFRNASTAIAGMSPAGPTGMTWPDNPRSVGDLHNLSKDQFAAVAHTNTLPVKTPERLAASEIARAPFSGTALVHQTTQNVEKGGKAIHGDYEGVKNPLGVQKTGHFDRDIWGETHPDTAETTTGMTGTVDKHMQDVMAGTTKPWSGKNAAGDRSRTTTTRKSGEDSLPMISSDKGYEYHRGVMQEAATSRGMRSKVGQATAWIVQKHFKDTAKKTRSRGSAQPPPVVD